MPGTPCRRALSIALATLAVLVDAPLARAQPRPPAASTPRSLERICARGVRRWDGLYVVQYDEDEGHFEYPPNEPFPMEHDEIVVCVRGSNLWNRYRLSFGRSRQGEPNPESTASIGFSDTQAVTTSLQATSAVIEAQGTCTSMITPEQHAACEDVRRDIAAVLGAERSVEVARNHVAQLLVDLSSRPIDEDVLALLRFLPNAFCARRGLLLPERPARGLPVIPTNPTSWCDHPLTIQGWVNQLLPHTIHWVDGEWHIYPDGFTAQASPGSVSAPIPLPVRATFVAPTGVAEEIARHRLEAERRVADLRAERTRLLALLQGSMQGYAELLALASRIVRESEASVRAFDLGRFDGGTILQATLERHTFSVAFSARHDRLEYRPVTTRLALNLSVHTPNWFMVQLGFVASGMENPTYRLEANPQDAARQATSRVVTSAQAFLRPAAFVNFLWCAQDLSRSFWARRCVHRHDLLRFLPSVSLGLPLGPETFDGNLFVGLSLPYVPYLSLVAGVHVGAVQRLRADVDPLATRETDVARLTETVASIAPFASVVLNSEVLSLLQTPVRAAQ